MTGSRGFNDQSFGFLEALGANNNRDWFNDHRDTFRDCLETPFANLLDALTLRLHDAAIPLTGGTKTMVRINRDVRFSADKAPYKTAVAGMLTPSGTKSEGAGVLYLRLDAKGGMVAAGYHALSPKQLVPIRQAMIDRAEAFGAVREGLAEAGRSLQVDATLSTMPKGFSDHAGHRHADAIRLKGLVVREVLPKKAWTSGDVVDRAEALARDTQPLLAFQRPG